MVTAFILATLLPLETVDTAFDWSTVTGLLLPGLLSSVAIGAVIKGLFDWAIASRTAKLNERKNANEEINERIERLKEAVREEREQKESALKILQELLEDCHEQIRSSSLMIETLNDTIDKLNQASDAQQSVINRLMEERDRTREALDRALKNLKSREREYNQYQQELEALDP